MTGSPNYVPDPDEQGISRNLTIQSLCKTEGVGKRDCKESKKSLKTFSLLVTLAVLSNLASTFSLVPSVLTSTENANK